ncbi:flippase [Methylomonas sp. EFPC1]|uniref:flippase n=1 Tax=Methylomonas sp. EFPC1 TaxID=2812647 RepID=UPI0019670EA9|nr:flippase [Methylomonas sp. EFPC1]QSA99636.1 flippase [Methylomonas sp. EFPC1]
MTTDLSWIKFLPKFISNRLIGRSELQLIVANTSWLFIDKIIRMGVGLFVGVWVARYLGPEQFGLWSYAIAFTSLFSAFASFGIDSIVVRELVKNPERQNELLGTAFVLKLIGGTLTLLIAIVAILLLRNGDTLTLWMVGISAAGFIFQSFNVIEFYFQARVRSKYTVLAASSAFIFVTVVKVILILSFSPLILFAWVGLIEVGLTSLFLIVSYKKDHNNICSWSCNKSTAISLMKNGWPLVFSSLAIMIQARVDQVMLGDMIGNAEVGQYSAAMRLIEVFSFLPTIIVSTLSPYITKAKLISETLYHERLLEIYRLMFILFLVVAIPIYFLGGEFVLFVFGDEYKRAGGLLSLFAIRLFFANFGVAKSLFTVNESLFKYALITAVIGAIVNILGNYLLIPYYGAEGAIISTIISFSITIFMVDLFYTPSRLNLYLMVCAVFIPYKLIKEKG